jgi:hypothetical protein
LDLNCHKFFGETSIIVFGVADYSKELNKEDLTKRRQKGAPDIEYIVRRVDSGMDPDRVSGTLLYRGAKFSLAISVSSKFADTSNLPVWLRRYKNI